jgi:BlaI family transcriptional regulator, penicillinase repressor
MSRSHRLGELQLAIMRVLWQEGEATVATVHAALRDQGDRALTTIATMLKKMEAKGVVTHRTDGRQFVFRPTVTEAAVKRTMVRDLTSSLFAGDVAALVTHLIDQEGIDPDELAELRAKIAEREAQEDDA